MEGAWAILPCEGEDTVRWELRNWYNTSSVADTHRGDMACASFEYVACIEYRSSSPNDHMVRLNMLEWDPYKSAWFLFYTRAENVIRVLGGIGFWDLYNLRGVVEMGDMVRSRAFLLPWDTLEEEQEEEEEEEEEDDHHFYLPCMFPEQKELLGDIVMDPAIIVADRVRWILKCEAALCQEELWASWEDGAPAHPNGPEVEFGAVFMASLLGNVLDRLDPERGGASRKRYEKAFLFAEHALFMYRMTRYFSTSNDDVMRLFAFNGLGDYMKTIVAEGSPADNQAYALRFPTAPKPKWYYQVPVEDVPLEVASTLPSHTNGTVCITIKDLPAWIWTKFILARIHARTRMMGDLLSGGGGGGGHRSVVESHLESIAVGIVCPHFVANPHAAAWRAKRRRKMVANPVSQRENQRQRLEDVDPGKGFQVADIEDMFNAAPPCLRSVIKGNGRFPRHMERLRLTQVLQSAEVSYASAVNFFERMNDRYPHPTKNYRDARARFDYDRAWKENQGPSYCGNLIRNAVNRRGEDVLKCPFVDKLPGPPVRPGQSYDALKEPCKRMCTGQANARFSGPHVLLKSALGTRPV
jgi:hypothetical protein